MSNLNKFIPGGREAADRKKSATKSTMKPINAKEQAASLPVDGYNHADDAPSASNSDWHMSAENIYDFYQYDLLPALFASVPILANRLAHDVASGLRIANERALHFLSPSWSDQLTTQEGYAATLGKQLTELFEQNLKVPANNQGAVINEFMLDHFDSNGDGHISPSELLNMTDLITMLRNPPKSETFWAWFSREWPLMDWKVGMFVWHTFGGLLLLICILSIIPGRLHSTSGKVLRWPILGLTYFLITVELIVYIVIRIGIHLAETLIATPRHRTLRRKMAQSKSYQAWYQYATALDISQKRDSWQDSIVDNTSYRYNWSFISQLIVDLKTARRKEDSLLAMAVLQQCTRKNVGGIMSEDLFSYTNTGEPKDIVKEFCTEVVKTLQWVTHEAHVLPEADTGAADESAAKRNFEKHLDRKVRIEKNKIWKTVVDWTTHLPSISQDLEPTDIGVSEHSSAVNDSERTMPGENIAHSSKALLRATHKEQLVLFLKRARAAYGRTALCLSGGAMMGLYHFGHIMGLMETDCLPNIISGTSAGSVVGAVVCTRTDEELQRDMTPEAMGGRIRCFARSWPDRIRSFYKNGALFDLNDWMDMIKWFTCGDMTFEEAYKKTGRVFCITLSSTTKKAPPVLLNYISAPNVTVASAVIASAAVPGFVPPVSLQYKDSDGTIKTKGGETYFDGSIETDIPINSLAEMLNCQFFIACQCNPHVVPFFFASKGGVGRPCRWSSGDQEASWRGGFLLAALEMYLKNDMKAKFVFLKDLEAAVGFTSTMMTQEFVGSTTIVPQVRIADFFKLFSDPDPNDLQKYFQGGSVAAYRHAAMIRLHYSIADALDDCLDKLERKGGTADEELSVHSSMSGRNRAIQDWAITSPAHRRMTMPSIISAALSTRHKAEGESTTDDDDSY